MNNAIPFHCGVLLEIILIVKVPERKWNPVCMGMKHVCLRNVRLCFQSLPSHTLGLMVTVWNLALRVSFCSKWRHALIAENSVNSISAPRDCAGSLEWGLGLRPVTQMCSFTHHLWCSRPASDGTAWPWAPLGGLCKGLASGLPSSLRSDSWTVRVSRVIPTSTLCFLPETYLRKLEEKLTQNKLILKEELRTLLHLCASRDDVELAKHVIYRWGTSLEYCPPFLFPLSPFSEQLHTPGKLQLSPLHWQLPSLLSRCLPWAPHV